MTYKSAVSGSDFGLPPEPKKSAIISIAGREKEGKTSAALNSPGPIAYFDIDRRGLHAVRRAIDAGKKVEYLQLPIPKKSGTKDTKIVMSDYQKVWDLFRKNYEAALAASEKGDIRTIIIDTSSDLWEIKMLAAFGRTDKIMPRDRGIPNMEFREMIRMARDFPVHVIHVEKAKEEWAGNEPTGNIVRKGHPELGYDVDVTTLMRINKKKKFELEVIRAGINAQINGNKYTEDDWMDYGPFVWLCTELYEGTSPDEWE